MIKILYIPTGEYLQFLHNQHGLTIDFKDSMYYPEQKPQDLIEFIVIHDAVHYFLSNIFQVPTSACLEEFEVIHD